MDNSTTVPAIDTLHGNIMQNDVERLLSESRDFLHNLKRKLEEFREFNLRARKFLESPKRTR